MMNTNDSRKQNRENRALEIICNKELFDLAAITKEIAADRFNFNLMNLRKTFTDIGNSFAKTHDRKNAADCAEMSAISLALSVATAFAASLVYERHEPEYYIPRCYNVSKSFLDTVHALAD